MEGARTAGVRPQGGRRFQATALFPAEDVTWAHRLQPGTNAMRCSRLRPRSSISMRTLCRVVPLALLVLTTACGHAKLVSSVKPTPKPAGYLFSNVNVFDGEQALGPRDVLVRNDRIEAVAPAGTLTAQDVTRIDG